MPPFIVPATRNDTRGAMATCVPRVHHPSNGRKVPGRLLRIDIRHGVLLKLWNNLVLELPSKLRPGLTANKN